MTFMAVPEFFPQGSNVVKALNVNAQVKAVLEYSISIQTYPLADPLFLNSLEIPDNDN